MRSRFVVEVVDESPSSSTSPVHQPSQPIADTPSVSPPIPSAPPTQVQDQVISPPKQVTQTAFQSVTLRDKLNSAEVSVQRISTFSQVPEKNATEPPDLFEKYGSRIEQAWQEETLTHAREVPDVRTPRVPKSQRVHPSIQYRENKPAAPNLEPKLERIERLFAHTGERNDSFGEPGSRDSKKSFGFSFPQVKLQRKVLYPLIFCFSALLVLGGASAAMYFDVRSAQSHVRALATQIGSGELSEAKTTAKILERKQQRYKKAYSVVRPVLSPLLGVKKSNHIESLFVLSDRGVQVMNDSLTAQETSSLAYRQFLGTAPGSAIDTSASISGQLESLYANLSGVQAEVTALQNPFGWSFVSELQAASQNQLPEARRGILVAQQILEVLPELIGKEGKQEYLVLLQNNAELRPTGGFIGSLGILTVENGKFLDFRVEDVYAADGQLNGYVEPPAELKQYLGEAQWYLRDVNWSPDFPTVAQQASWFLDKSLRIQPDGVIGINLSVAQEILRVTGPISLIDYGEVITADNLYERAQTHAEANFFPGSSQKKDFLSAVATALFQKVLSGNESSTALLPALYQSAQESQLLISVQNPKAQSVMSAVGWDGGVRTPDCPQAFTAGNCFVDTVLQVEANVGVNKANQYIRREIVHTANIADTDVLHSRTVTLHNTAQSHSWPQGAYKSYFRLFVSPRASVIGVTVDGQVLAPEMIHLQQEMGKQVIGFLVNTPINSQSVVNVQYRVPLESSWTAYALFEQKQSGTGAQVGSDTLQHNLVVNHGRVTLVAPEPQINAAHAAGGVQRYTFESTRETHQFMAVEITP